MTPSEAQAYCTGITKRSGSNFYYSFLFLPRHKREAMYTVYAFCRAVDSTVDDPPPGQVPADELTRWRAEVAAAYDGAPSHPVTVSLGQHARRFGIPRDYCEELIAGVEMDLTISRYATFQDLSLYCYRVASVVGLICLKIFETRSPLAHEYAVNLGQGFQLTNILRDVATDADRGRVYLPQEDLARFCCLEDDLLKKSYSPGFVDLMRFECARARESYAKARQIANDLPVEDRRALTVAEIMRGVYWRILNRIEGSGYRVFDSRITLPHSTRLLVAAGTWVRSRLPSLRTKTEPHG